MFDGRLCRCGYNIKPIRCPQCNARGLEKWIDSNARECDDCHWQNHAYIDTTTSMQKSMSKKMSGRIYEMLVFELLGAFAAFGMPFFGLPSMPWLAVALMALFPFYIFLPSEHEAIASRQQGTESLGAEAGGLLVLKGMVKTMIFAFVIVQFFVLPVSKLIPLGISFFYYFTLPTYYKTTQPFRMIEAWIRVGVGGLIAFFMLLAFAGTIQAWMLVAMSAAFFCTSFPHHKEAEPHEAGEVRVDVNLIPVVGKGINAARERIGGQLDGILDYAFLILMALALYLSNIGLPIGFVSTTLIAVILIGILRLVNVSGGSVAMLIALAVIAIGAINGAFNGDMLNIIFLSVWVLSLMAGLAAGKTGRPSMGILMIFMTFVVLSFTATGMMGQAVFGYWWPQVEAVGEMIAAPIGPLIEQMQTSIEDSVLLFTNPMAYYDTMNKRSVATKTVVKEGGSVKSIELSKSDLFTSVPGQLEPLLDPLVGSFEIQNQGEFDANKIKLDLWASWQDPTKMSISRASSAPINYGTLLEFECSKPNTPSPTIGTCFWESTTYPKEVKVVNFVFEKGVSSWRDLASCIDYDKIPVGCDDVNATYLHGSETIKVNANLTYDYNVNVSIPVDIISLGSYQDLLQAGEITLVDNITSQYTGGPVKVTLWSQRQPIRAGESSLFVASIYNDGQGEINNAELKLMILTSVGEITPVSSTFYNGNINTDGCGGIDSASYWGYNVITCTHNLPSRPIKSGEYVRFSFMIKPSESSLGGADRISRLIVGLANYEYVKTFSKSITIANNPWH
ncbi:MAG: zinc ribbon domain-containing protein [Candidatus Aenigmatarchaeota archaeon]